MINIKENEKLSVMNHSCAHLLAQAVQHLYPNAKFWVRQSFQELTSDAFFGIFRASALVRRKKLQKILAG